MTDITNAPERIRVAQDADGFWTCREAISGSQEYVRADIYDAALSTPPIAVEGKVKALEWIGDEGTLGFDVYAEPDPYHRYTVRHLAEGRFDVILNTDTGSIWFAQQTFPVTFHASYADAKAAAQSDFETRILSALISSPGKDGGQEVEAVVWSERENAFTDFWEQCPKLVDASDVGKARQAFMAGMDAASFFDGPATNAAIYAVANFLKERDEAVLPDEIDDDEREASARCILRVIGKASSQPASTALVERLEAERAEQWRLRREAEGSRDAARAAADSLRVERDALKAAIEPFAKLYAEIPEDNFWPSEEYKNLGIAAEAYALSASTSREGER